MPIHLFNPPEPHGEPTTLRSQLGTRQNGASSCGTCQCVPRFWQVIGSAPGAPAYTQLFMSQVLRRDYVTWDSGQTAPCQWGCSFDLFAATGVHQTGSIVLNSQGSLFGWGVTFYGLTRTPPGVDDIQPYDNAGVNGPPEPRPFRCLSPNLFQRDPGGSGNFVGMPATIILQPFWP